MKNKHVKQMIASTFGIHFIPEHHGAVVRYGSTQALIKCIRKVSLTAEQMGK